SGEYGQISGTPGASTTLTLAKPDDITNFEVGQRLVFAANSASALRDSGAHLTVVAVNLSAGTMVMSANLNTITGLADGDAIFVKGDYEAADDRNKISGLAAWLPASAPGGSDSFFGVNRSVDPVRLAGHRLSGRRSPL
ncbi:MAG: hypothetical protein ACYTFK_13185, partial [Planctomycetota bacterium]